MHGDGAGTAVALGQAATAAATVGGGGGLADQLPVVGQVQKQRGGVGSAASAVAAAAASLLSSGHLALVVLILRHQLKYKKFLIRYRLAEPELIQLRAFLWCGLSCMKAFESFNFVKLI